MSSKCCVLHTILPYMLKCYVKYMIQMDTYCDDNVDGGDLKGGIQGGAHRTAVYLGERYRYMTIHRDQSTRLQRESREIY